MLIRFILILLIYIKINKSSSLLDVKLYNTLFCDFPLLDELFNMAYIFSSSFG